MSGRRRLLPLLLSLVVIAGCGSSTSVENSETTNPAKENIDVQNTQTAKPTESSEPAADIWTDNGSDMYMGTVKAVIQPEEPEKLLSFSGNTFLSENCGGIFRKYFFEDKAIERTFLIDASGVQKAIDLEVKDYGVRGRLGAMGTIAGEGGYVFTTYAATQEKIEQWAVLTDADWNASGSFKLPEDMFLPTTLMADLDGNVFFTNYDEEKGWQCLAFDKEGNIVWDCFYPEYDFLVLTPFPDGRVGIYAGIYGDGEKYCLILPNVESGEETILSQTEKRVLFLTLFDETSMLYADNHGLYRCSLTLENTETLYKWASHGIHISEIVNMAASSDGEISILFTAEGDTTFLHLQSDTDGRDIIEVPFAVSEENLRIYQEAIAKFNKEHPAYVITAVSYAEDLKLLTELTAGEGPVLIDTALVSFAENKELWECMDEEFAQSGLSDELLEKPLEAGKIEGKLYGMVPEWQLFTFASASVREAEWDYESFLSYLEQHKELQYIYAEQSPVNFMKVFLLRALEDCQFVDMTTGKAYFDTGAFAEAVAIAERMAAERTMATKSEQILQLQEGSCLGEFAYIMKPESIAYYDTILGEETNYIGFPGVNGSRHYMTASSPLAVRATALEEEKEGAFLFLESLFSYEAQKGMVEAVGLSVRRDVFEEQLNALEAEITYRVDGEAFTIPVDAETVKEKFLALYENSVPYPSLPESISAVLEEELESCFLGEKSAEEVGKVLQNRIQLYLYENQ